MKAGKEIKIQVRVEGTPEYGDWEWDLEELIRKELKANFSGIISYECTTKGIRIGTERSL